KLAWVCLLVSPLVLGGAIFFLPDPDPITRANFERIRKIFRKEGMTVNDIESVLGRKAVRGGRRGGAGTGPAPGPEDYYYWEGSSGVIIAWLRNERIWMVEFEDRERPTILDKVRNCLGW